MTRTVRAADLAELPRGTRVSLSGTARSLDPVDPPRGGPPLLGFSVACTVFLSGRRGLPEFDATHHVARWKNAVLEDASGSVQLGLAASVVRAPATEEETLHDLAEMERVLTGLGLRVASPAQIQLLQRCVPDGARVTVTGTVDVVSDNRGAFRSSARPELVLLGARAAPLVLVPR